MRERGGGDAITRMGRVFVHPVLDGGRCSVRWATKRFCIFLRETDRRICFTDCIDV